jgi:hypothetical protein
LPTGSSTFFPHPDKTSKIERDKIDNNMLLVFTLTSVIFYKKLKPENKSPALNF